MFFVSQIPHLKLYRQKAMLPVDDKASTMYGLVFINNQSTKAAIDVMNSPVISHNHKYNLYYIDGLYQGKLFSASFRDVFTHERDTIYKELSKSLRYMGHEKSFASINTRNVYVDLQHHNRIFFRMAHKKGKTYGVKATAYINHLKELIEDEQYNKYKSKVMLINIDDWVQNIGEKINKVERYDNAIFLLYYAMYKQFEVFQSLGNIDIIFTSGNQAIRVNPSQTDKLSYRLFRTELTRIHSSVLEEDDDKLDHLAKREEIYQEVTKRFGEQYNFTGDSGDADVDGAVNDRIEEMMQDEDTKQVEGKELADKLTQKLLNDEKLMKDIYTITQEKKTGRSTISMKRDQELREKQKQIKMDNMTLDQLRELNSRNIEMEKLDVTGKVSTTNKNVTSIEYPHFEKAYNKHLLKKDLINNIMSLNDKSIPVYIRDIKVEDTSNEMSLKETYTVQLEDANRVRHTLKFDMPIFIDDKFMYLNGNKKLIVKQLYMKPVVKTGPSEVQVLSSYNKIFIRRYGAKLSAKVEKFKKSLVQEIPGVVVKYGNNVAVNSNYKTTIEYDEISKDITYIRIGKTEFYFNQDDVKKLIKERGLEKKIKENEMCIGFINKTDPITFDPDKQDVEGELDIVDFILSVGGEKLVQNFNDASAGKKYVYSRATIMSKQVPIILLLGYLEGLSTVLRKGNIQHYFSDTRPKVDRNQGVVQFSNGYLVYDKYPFQNSLLLNAFADIPTKAFTYEEFDSREAYLTIFDTMYNTKMIGNAFDNFYEFMIDPITKEVLEDLNYPTDFVSLILFAQSLLADNSYIMENNMNLYRVRSNELVNAYLYKAIADAYSSYRLTANNNNPVKISIPQDAITKKILMAQTVEDYSILNPIVELEKSRAITPKGHSGMNLDDAYTQDKRSYDKTMMGLLAMSTSPDAKK